MRFRPTGCERGYSHAARPVTIGIVADENFNRRIAALRCGKPAGSLPPPLGKDDRRVVVRQRERRVLSGHSRPHALVGHQPGEHGVRDCRRWRRARKRGAGGRERDGIPAGPFVTRSPLTPMKGHGDDGDRGTRDRRAWIMSKRHRSVVRAGARRARGVLVVAVAILTMSGNAEAVSFRFVNTGNPIPANFGYYSARRSHYEVYMTKCQSPQNWSARVRETAGGSGAQIRSLSAPCGGQQGNIAMSWWGPDADTRVWCYNLTSSSKYAECWELYV